MTSVDPGGVLVVILAHCYYVASPTLHLVMAVCKVKSLS